MDESARRWRRRPILSALAAASFVPTAAALASPAKSSREPLRFGVFPYLPPLTIDKVLGPIIHGLSHKLERPIHLRTKTDFDTFRSALTAGSYDFALGHPFLCAEAIDVEHYQPVVRSIDPLEMLFLAPDGSEIQNLDDLKSRTLALPPRPSAVSLLAQWCLQASAVWPGDVEQRYFSSKMAILRAVASGDADACCLPSFALKQAEANLTHNLLPFHRFVLPTGLGIVAHPFLDDADIDDLIHAFAELDDTVGGREALRMAGFSGFTRMRTKDLSMARSIASNVILPRA